MSICVVFAQLKKIEITIIPDQNISITTEIQKAIDSCESGGEGGIVFFPIGSYLTGTLQLKSNITLKLEKGAIIRGSNRYIDYRDDALIYGINLTNIAIQGEGIIDGVDCRNPNGEEGFRGPHCIRLINCKGISLTGITIKNAANWAINCRESSYAKIENVSIRGGHDGLHTRFCRNFTVKRCDFRTGDDAFAGNDNRDFLITDCKINTSCNGFRIGCYNFVVERCVMWGPGEFKHKISNRTNMIAAFVHFSPEDEKPRLISGNWLIKDVTIQNVDYFYRYNYIDGLWQTGMPATILRFDQIKATGLLSSFSINGDTARKFNLSIKNSSFSYREGATSIPDSFEGVNIRSAAFFNASNFNQIKLANVDFNIKATSPIFTANNGNYLRISGVKFIPSSSKNFVSLSNIKKINNSNENH